MPAGQRKTPPKADLYDPVDLREVVFKTPTHYSNFSNKATGRNVLQIVPAGVVVGYRDESVVVVIPWGNIASLRIDQTDPIWLDYKAASRIP